MGRDHGWVPSMVAFNRPNSLGLPISPHLLRRLSCDGICLESAASSTIARVVEVQIRSDSIASYFRNSTPDLSWICFKREYPVKTYENFKCRKRLSPKIGQHSKIKNIYLANINNYVTVSVFNEIPENSEMVPFCRKIHSSKWYPPVGNVENYMKGGCQHNQWNSEVV